MSKGLFLGIIVVLIGGCTSNDKNKVPEYLRGLDNVSVFPADSKPTHSIHLVREYSYGDTDEVVIGNPGTLGVDEAGRVYIGDIQRKWVHIFEPDGSYVTHLGREGSTFDSYCKW